MLRQISCIIMCNVYIYIYIKIHVCVCYIISNFMRDEFSSCSFYADLLILCFREAPVPSLGSRSIHSCPSWV